MPETAAGPISRRDRVGARAAGCGCPEASTRTLPTDALCPSTTMEHSSRKKERGVMAAVKRFISAVAAAAVLSAVTTTTAEAALVDAGRFTAVSTSAPLFDASLGDDNGCDPAGCVGELTRVSAVTPTVICVIAGKATNVVRHEPLKLKSSDACFGCRTLKPNSHDLRDPRTEDWATNRCRPFPFQLTLAPFAYLSIPSLP